jgi:polyhydroxybutyrate depolymerase
MGCSSLITGFVAGSWLVAGAIGCSSEAPSTASGGAAATVGGAVGVAGGGVSSAGVAGNNATPSGGVTAGGVANAAGGTAVAGAGAGSAAGGTAGSAAAGAGGAAGSMAGAGADPGPCTGVNLKPGNTNATLEHAGAKRDYIIHVPPAYTGKARVPLLIDMHGSGQSASAQMGTSHWNGKADAMGFIVIYPNALNARWNAGTCCSPSMELNIDDLGFLRAVVEKTTTDGCIDRKRVYASGLSGGGLMAYRLACMAADMFAAVAPVSGADVTIPCTPSAPVSVVAFRGLMDDTVPYAGGMPLRWYWPAAQADYDQFIQLDKCSGADATSHTVCKTRSQCAGGADVTLCSIHGGHILYDAAAGEGAGVPDVAWEVFQRHTLP